MRKVSLLALCFLSAVGGFSKEVSSSRALAVAQAFLQQKAKAPGSLMKAPAKASAMHLAWTATSKKSGANNLYVFNNDGGGFVIVSGDDRAQQVLGYSDTGRIDYDRLPQEARNWLQSYSDQIDYLRMAPATATTDPSNPHYDKPVAPLTSAIQWNQDSPYNDQCPVLSIGQRCPTGCVATAMAQVMYYYRYPAKGQGSFSYKPSILNGGELSANFGATTYEWDKMLPTYTNEASKESSNAVATLMLQCGVAVSMEYSSSSGAASLPIPYALHHYFGYDRSVAYRQRANYTADEWQEVIVNEINHSRPVVATGVASSGGHCFLFDGYDTDGLIHVNWGWGGMSNGYFRTSALLPAVQGIGGADGGYNYNQQIITGIQPATTGLEDDVELVSTEGLVVGQTTIDNGATVGMTLAGLIHNAGWQTADVEYGLLLKDAEGQEVKAIATGVTANIPVGYETSSPAWGTISLGHLADGTYRLYPVCRNKGGKAWMRVRDEYVGYPNWLTVSVKDGKQTFSQPGYFTLEATYADAPTEMYSGMVTRVKAHISNTGEADYLGNVAVAVVSKTTGRTVATGEAYKIDLAQGQGVDLDLLNTFKLDAGDYSLTITDDDGRRIAPLQSITVKAATGVTPTFEPAQPLAFDDAEHVDKADVKFTAHVRCTKGYIGGYAYLFLLNESGAVQKGALAPQYIHIEEGQTADISFSGPFENGVPGTKYQACLILGDGAQYYFLNGSREASSCAFRLDNASGISQVETNANGKARLYNIDGTPANPSGHGLFILKQGGKTYKIAK